MAEENQRIDQQRKQMVKRQIRNRGIRSLAILRAFEAVPRQAHPLPPVGKEGPKQLQGLAIHTRRLVQLPDQEVLGRSSLEIRHKETGKGNTRRGGSGENVRRLLQGRHAGQRGSR